MVLDEYFPKLGKCIYIWGKVLTLHDLGEFYRICSVDDYMAVGVPRTLYDPAEPDKIINSNFKAIFVELFGGGHAELILTEPDNVLESGIEISVAPPGKVIKNLISLSGGEQSFIAIAIYFAILKLRPAPFCILDEIDAALDEVNVRKYAQYLKKFTDTTQFVLVTHRRSAMEEANVLYGVTMQEDGISKLLKMEQVDFQEEQ